MNIQNQPEQLNLFFDSDDKYLIDFDIIYSPEKYIVTNSNFYQTSYLSDIKNWKIDKICMIYGPKFSGKTHLSYISHKKNQNSILINKNNHHLISDHSIFDQKDMIIIDDIEYLNEEVIFHFFNYAKLSQKFLLLSVEENFLKNIKLKDLKSRIQSIPSFELNFIDEGLLNGIIIKILSDYDISLSYSQLKFISMNLERSFEMINIFTSKIKKFVFENSKKITINQIKNILNSMKI